MSSADAYLARLSPLSSLVMLFGIGDCQFIQALAAHPQFQKKDLRALAFPGETLPQREWPKTFRVSKIENFEGFSAWVSAYFADHNDIIRLGGADIIDDLPLADEAQAFRAEHLPRMLRMLQDRPWSLGNDINDTFMGLHHAALNAKTILPMPSIGQLAGTLGQTPAIAIGAGPSLGRHLDALRVLQHKCLLVSCDAAYPGLVKAGIIPHVVTPLERLQQQAPLVKAVEGTHTVFGGIAACHPDTLKPFAGRALYLHAMDRLYDWLAPGEELRCLTGSSTGVLSFYVAASLTRGPVYLVGHDCAKGEHSHWDGAEMAGKAFQAETANAGGLGENGYEVRWIPGNNGQLVQSIMWWDQFRHEIASQAGIAGSRIFNVNAHDKIGAVIEHTLAAPLPNADDLADFGPWELKPIAQERYTDWQRRASRIEEDADNFLTAMDRLREDIRCTYHKSPHTWDLEALMAKANPGTGVSEGNVAAFHYVLRSALYNEQAMMSAKARHFRGKLEAQYRTMQSLDGLADAMSNAVRHMKPLFTSFGT